MARISPAASLLLGSLLFSGGIASRPAGADTPAAVMRLGQGATASIWRDDESRKSDRPDMVYRLESRGTAFCITRTGYFVTAAHVVGNADEMHLSLETQPKHVASYDAQVIKRDKKLDLALLKIDVDEPLTPIDVTTPFTVTRGTHVTAFGFPVHGKEFYNHDLFYSASIHGGSVTALYGQGHALTDVQANTGLGPGASGGPLLNDRGQLVGILQKGRKDSHANMAKSVNALRTFLADAKTAAALRKPELLFSPQGEFSPSEMFARDYKVDAKVLAGLEPLPPAQATLTIETFGQPARVLHGEIGPNGLCNLAVRLLPPPPETHAVTLKTWSKDPAQTVSCRVQDSPLKIGTRTFPLSEAAHIVPGTPSVVFFRSGERVEGSLSGLEALHPLENGQVPTKLEEMQRIVVHDEQALPGYVTCHLEVTRADKPFLERSWRVYVNGGPRKLGQPLLLACGSAWATNDTGKPQGRAADLSPATVQYIHNVAQVLTNGFPSNILIYSDHWMYGAPFQEVLRSEGHAVSQSTNPGRLDVYDAIFVGGSEVDKNELINYIHRGGKVYMAGGQDAHGGDLNDILNRFGLYIKNAEPADRNAENKFTYPPLFHDVQNLKLNGEMHLARTEDAHRDTQIITTQTENSLWAICQAGEKFGPDPLPVAKAAPPKRPDLSSRFPEFNNLLAARNHFLQALGRQIDMITPPGGGGLGFASHKLEKSATGVTISPHSCSAEDGGWFSYEIKVDPNKENQLVIDIFSSEQDQDRRGFDVLIDGVKLAEPKLLKSLPGSRPTLIRATSRLTYLIPKALTVGKDHVMVRVQAQPGKTTGQIIFFRVFALFDPEE